VQNTAQGTPSAAGTAESGRRDVSLWWYVMIAVLLLALAESLLGNKHLSVDKEAHETLDRLSDYLAPWSGGCDGSRFREARRSPRGRPGPDHSCGAVINHFAFPTQAWSGRECSSSWGWHSRCGGADCAGDPPQPPRRRAQSGAQFPQFEERLLTFSERLEQDPGDPFLSLLADDTLAVAGRPSRRCARTGWIFRPLFRGLFRHRPLLLWLGTSGPGFMGYGTALLWGGLPKTG